MLDFKRHMETFQKIDGETTTSFNNAMAGMATNAYKMGFVQGTDPKQNNVLEVPYNIKNLLGQALKDQVDEWVSYGTIEECAGMAIKNCIDKPGYLDLSDQYFLLLGAGSAMGPFLVLMALGADLDRPNIWNRLITFAQQSPGTITSPLKIEQSLCATNNELYTNAGCNLFTDTPVFVIGSSTYILVSPWRYELTQPARCHPGGTQGQRPRVQEILKSSLLHPHEFARQQEVPQEEHHEAPPQRWRGFLRRQWFHQLA